MEKDDIYHYPPISNQISRDRYIDIFILLTTPLTGTPEYDRLELVKCTHFSLTLWVLGDSKNGYFSRIEVYTGKKGNDVKKKLGAKAVKRASMGGDKVNFDNFFTFKGLLSNLEQLLIYGIGSQDDRKHFPENLKNMKFKTR